MKISKLFVIILSVVALSTLLFTKNSSSHLKKNKDKLYHMGKDLNDSMFGARVPDVLCLNYNGDSTKLSKLVCNQIVLVYFYSDKHCNTCYEKQLELLQDYFSHSENKVVVLASYLSYRNYKVHMLTRKYNLSIYYVEQNAFNWHMNDYESPYFFVLDSQMNASYFYLNNNYEQNKDYFRYIAKLLLD